MTSAAQDLLEQAKKLPHDERQALAEAIWDTLEEEEPPLLSPEWNAEISSILHHGTRPGASMDHGRPRSRASKACKSTRKQQEQARRKSHRKYHHTGADHQARPPGSLGPQRLEDIGPD